MTSWRPRPATYLASHCPLHLGDERRSLHQPAPMPWPHPPARGCLLRMQIMYAIRTRSGTVYMKIKSNNGDLSAMEVRPRGHAGAAWLAIAEAACEAAACCLSSATGGIPLVLEPPALRGTSRRHPWLSVMKWVVVHAAQIGAFMVTCMCLPRRHRSRGTRRPRGASKSRAEASPCAIPWHMIRPQMAISQLHHMRSSSTRGASHRQRPPQRRARSRVPGWPGPLCRRTTSTMLRRCGRRSAPAATMAPAPRRSRSATTCSARRMSASGASCLTTRLGGSWRTTYRCGGGGARGGAYLQARVCMYGGGGGRPGL